MKTIEIISKGQEVQFTTKSVTIAGKEYLYSHITELRHSEAKHVYGFKCDGEVVLLPYEEKDTRVLKAIFSQVQQMHSKPAPAAEKKQEAPAPVPAETPAAETAPEEAPAEEVPVEETPAEAPVEVPAVEEVPAETPVEEVTVEEEIIPAEAFAEEAPAPAETPVSEEAPAETPAEEAAAETPVGEAAAETPVAPAEGEETPAEEVPAETPAEEVPAETPALSEKEKAKEEKRRLKEQRKADKEAAKREKQAAKAKGGVSTYSETAAEMDPALKQSRFKKGIIIFIIILAVAALLGIAYYFLIGPASDPQIGPNTTDQTQYNDIDDMINDLEEN